MELGNWAFGNSRGKYPVDRDWQDAFCSALFDMRFDGYGMPELDESWYGGEFKNIESEHGEARYFENEIFTIMPYYWGDDDEICDMPNFVHKPSGLKLSWYKYPLRDSYANKKITFDTLMDILEDCKESLGCDDIPYHYRRAIEHIDRAATTLFCMDNKVKTHEVYSKLCDIIDELKKG